MCSWQDRRQKEERMPPILMGKHSITAGFCQAVHTNTEDMGHIGAGVHHAVHMLMLLPAHGRGNVGEGTIRPFPAHVPILISPSADTWRFCRAHLCRFHGASPLDMPSTTTMRAPAAPALVLPVSKAERADRVPSVSKACCCVVSRPCTYAVMALLLG